MAEDRKLTVSPYRLRARDGAAADGELGRLRVPENRRRPNARTIEIAFVRLRSTARRPLSPVVFLAGGPGESGVRAASGRLFDALLALRDVSDVIALDSRGVGLGAPVLGFALDAEISRDLFSCEESMLDRARRECAFARDAFLGDGVDLAAYHTVEMADDLDDLRGALGVERLTLWGYSYGTHLALAYLKRHEESVDRLILCGVEGPDHTLKLPCALDRHLERLSELVRGDPRAERVGDFTSLVRDVLDGLDRTPAHAEVALSGERLRCRIGRFAAQYLTVKSFTDRRAYAHLPRAYTRAARGEYGPLAEWVVKQWQRRPRNAVYYLSDGASGASPERLRRIRREAAGAVLGDAANFPFPSINDTWKTIDLGDHFRSECRSAVPALFVSGTLDSNTPPEQAEAIRSGFPNGAHLRVANAAHNELAGTASERDAMVRFLRGGLLGEERASLPIPSFEPLD